MITLSREKMDALRSVLGVPGMPEDLLRQAVTHSSASAEMPALHDYERLEFLGDAVLEMVVTRHLFHQFSDRPEGWMTWMRQVLVSEEALSAVGRDLDLPRYTVLGTGSAREGTAHRDSVIADQVEAILAVIYLAVGLDAADAFIWPRLVPIMERHEEEGDMRDPKSRLQEELQKKGPVQIRYELLSREGKPPREVFVSAVMRNGETLATGQGGSKQISEKEAAKAALQAILKARR